MNNINKSKSNRSCSYCFNIGHTKTTCALRKQHLRKAEELNADARKQFFKKIDELGFYVNSFIEMIYTDFFNSEKEIQFFYVKEIRWKSINKSHIFAAIDKKLKYYLESCGTLFSNFGNVVIVSPQYPNGLRLSLTIENITKMSENKKVFSIENNDIGDFRVIDVGDREQTCQNIPENYFEGKFYTHDGHIVK